MSGGRWVWVPEGWRVVPEELTPEMYEAAEATSIQVYTGTITYDVSTVYRATLAAAPEPPSGWRHGPPPVEGWCLIAEQDRASRWFWSTALNRRLGGDWDNTTTDDEWWTPLPPPPEERP